MSQHPRSRADEWRFPNRATPPGSSAYYSVRFSPPALRETIAALYGWHREVHAILDDVSDPGVARLKLDWWRAETERTAAGEPRHPLSQVLAPGMAEHALPQAPFRGIADRVEDTLRGRRSADDEDQRDADEHDSGALFELIARCHGAAEDEPIAAARRVGAWCARVRRIRDAGMLARRAREVLPSDRLEAAGLNHEALVSLDHRHRLPELLQPVADKLQAERPGKTDIRPLAPALRVQARIHAALLHELRRCDLAVVDQRIGLTPLRKLWIAWRAA
ncbi:MAG: squalene/phytoene synthase family protein [Thiohalocapsa sp.]|nr:squalene/phytoene synthase family protein [Thiohalocapsa sp.]